MSLTLGEASKQSGFAKSSLSQAVSKGRLAAVRRQNGSFAIDEAELARFVEANASPVRVERVETLPSVQSEPLTNSSPHGCGPTSPKRCWWRFSTNLQK